MFRIDTNKTWSGRHCTGDIVFVREHRYEKRISKNFKPSQEKWISLKLHKPANTTLSCQKAVEKNKTNKDDTKRIFIKLPYIKEINGHIPKEINGFLKKLYFKVTFILINEMFNLKHLFAFKEHQNKVTSF